MTAIAITFGTIAYHLWMRWLVGLGYRKIMKNKANYKKRYYQVSKFEMSLYKKLKVKKWKNKMPTFDDTLFNPQIHTWEEIAQAMCQAELVHETNAVLSFLPIVAGHWFGAYPVFIITSILAALVDLLFVIIQRYNRQRIVNFLERTTG